MWNIRHFRTKAPLFIIANNNNDIYEINTFIKPNISYAQMVTNQEQDNTNRKLSELQTMFKIVIEQMGNNVKPINHSPRQINKVIKFENCILEL